MRRRGELIIFLALRRTASPATEALYLLTRATNSYAIFVFLSLFLLSRLSVSRFVHRGTSIPFCTHKEARAREKRSRREKDGWKREKERERAKKSEAVEGKKEDSRRFNTR